MKCTEFRVVFPQPLYSLPTTFFRRWSSSLWIELPSLCVLCLSLWVQRSKAFDFLVNRTVTVNSCLWLSATSENGGNISLLHFFHLVFGSTWGKGTGNTPFRCSPSFLVPVWLLPRLHPWQVRVNQSQAPLRREWILSWRGRSQGPDFLTSLSLFLLFCPSLPLPLGASDSQFPSLFPSFLVSSPPPPPPPFILPVVVPFLSHKHQLSICFLQPKLSCHLSFFVSVFVGMCQYLF